jgi:FtsH-binding integral membrane protein
MVQAFTIDPTSFPGGKFTSFGPLINLALPLALTGAGLIFLAMTLYAAFNILTHGDNPDALKKAYSAITAAVVGLIIVVASYLVIKLLGVLP